MLGLKDTPYSLDGMAEHEIGEMIAKLEARIAMLRSTDVLTDETLSACYGMQRFKQVAESNAIEGSTLSAGETELAVMKGMTITGHDPASIRDAIALDKALQRLVALAGDRTRTTEIAMLHQLHGLLLGDRPGAGVFRKEQVRIRGAAHMRPKTWEAVMDEMELWQQWSQTHAHLPAPIRATILHSWLTHIHPYIDGNGRCARAVSNLELIRAGYPPIIIRKKERGRYLEALAASDEGSDIQPFFELILERIEGALTGLELSATKEQNYNPVVEAIKQQQRQQLTIWLTSTQLLANTIAHFLQERLSAVGGIQNIEIFEGALDLEDFGSLCNRQAVSRSWAFKVKIQIPSLASSEWLFYFGYRSAQMFHQLGDTGGPSLFPATKNPQGFPRWTYPDPEGDFAEMTTKAGVGDQWHLRHGASNFATSGTTNLGRSLANLLFKKASTM